MADEAQVEEDGAGHASDRLNARETFLLYALSAARCARCRRALVLESEVSGKPFNIGKRAHIVGRSEDGPRGDGGLEPSDRGHLTNHVLLCGTCHDEVDADEESWPVDRLRSMRAEHAAWIDERLGDDPEPPDQQVYAHLVASARDLVGLDHWIGWTEYMFELPLSWRPQQMEDVAEFVRRIGATDWPGTLPELECALKRLAQCLSQAAGTFSDRAEKRTHDLHVPRAYKRGWNPNYGRDAEAFARWVREYEALLVEATRAAAWVRSAWRAAGHPMFMLGEVPQIVTTANADDRIHFYAPAYTESERGTLLSAPDLSEVLPLPFFIEPPNEDDLTRLLREVYEAVSGSAPTDDVVSHLEDFLRTAEAPFDTSALFRGMPGRMPDAGVRKRVTSELLDSGVLARNPAGRGFVVADLGAAAL